MGLLVAGRKYLAIAAATALAACGTAAAPPPSPAPHGMWKIVIVKEPLAADYVGPMAAILANPLLKAYHEFLILENDRGQIVDELNAYCEKVQSGHQYRKQGQFTLFGDPTSRLGMHDAVSSARDPQVALVSPDWAEHSLYLEPTRPDWKSETFVLTRGDAIARWHRAMDVARQINRLAIPYTDTARQHGEGRNSNSALVTLVEASGLGDPLQDAFVRDAYGAGIDILPDLPRLTPILSPDASGIVPFGAAPDRATNPDDFRALQDE